MKDNEQLNTWQQIAGATNDIVTPANAVDAVAFAGSIYGISHIDEWKGIGVAAASYGADIVDGKIARATGTESDLGEFIDAGGDKIKLALASLKAWQNNLAPKPLLAAIAIQNATNVLITGVDRNENDQPVIHPSKLGKRAMFFQQSGIGIHIIGARLERDGSSLARPTKLAGNILGAAGVVLGVVASAGYARTLAQSRHRQPA